VKAGSKQTKIGVIPEDWSVVSLDTIGKIRSGTTPPRAKQQRYFGGANHWVKTLDLNNSIINSTDENVTDDALRETVLEMFPRGTVLVAMYGGFNQIGRTGLLSVPAAVNQAVSAIMIDQKIGDPRLLLFQLNYMVDEWKKVASSSRKDPNITSKDVKRFEIALPPTIDEQKAIAGALSDVDGLIAGLEALIAKKRSLKTATMQQLLTGKTRLPGFNGQWTKREFGELATIRNQKVNTFRNVLAKSCIELEQIESGTGRVSRFEDASNRHTSKYSFTAGDVLFGRLRPYLAKYFLASQNGVCSTEIWPLIGTGATQLFLYQLVQSQGFIDAASEAYGTHMPRADWKILRVLHMAVPMDLAEQDAIGGVLFDMEIEITALIEKLAKAKALKQGMMQELLTGRTRLI